MRKIAAIGAVTKQVSTMHRLAREQKGIVQINGHDAWVDRSRSMATEVSERERRAIAEATEALNRVLPSMFGVVIGEPIFEEDIAPDQDAGSHSASGRRGKEAPGKRRSPNRRRRTGGNDE